MEKIMLTKQQYRALVETIRKAQDSQNQIIKSGYESGSSQDGHHDEGFQLSLRESAVANKRVEILHNILNNAKIIEPREQKESVRIGNGVVIEYTNGKEFQFVLVGYVIETESRETMVSTKSPLGMAVIGAHTGERKEFSVGNRKIKIQIKDILLPSQTA